MIVKKQLDICTSERRYIYTFITIIIIGYKEQQELLAKTSQELNKTREMLVMQHKINKDYHQEVIENMSSLFLSHCKKLKVVDNKWNAI